MAVEGFGPIGPRRAFESAVEQIGDRIRLGDFAAGDRLPSERELAEAMRISRPTLREAIQVLVQAGVVDVRRGAGGGIFVRSDYVPLDLVRARSDLRLGEVAGVLEARRLIEPRVAQLAALNGRDDDFAAMAATIASHRALVASGDVLGQEDRFLQIDTQFHLRMAQATGNTTIVPIMRMTLRRMEIARDLALRQPPTPEWVIDVHERTLAAIRSADHPRIELVMDEHLAGLERAWEADAGRSLVRPVPDFLLPPGRRSAGVAARPDADREQGVRLAGRRDEPGGAARPHG